MLDPAESGTGRPRHRDLGEAPGDAERSIPLTAKAVVLGMREGWEGSQLIAKHIPAFERYIPPPRKPWMSEDPRMGLFDAVALGLVFFQEQGFTSDY
jgi:hypothetical protein